MSDNKFCFKINIGDWSKDGHNQSDFFIINSDKPVEKVQDAFISAAVRIGLLNLTERRFALCDKYEDNTLTSSHIALLRQHNVYIDDLFDNEDTNSFTINNPFSFAVLMMRIAALELDFTYTIEDPKINLPNFNGYWNAKLNLTLGYGLYY